MVLLWSSGITMILGYDYDPKVLLGSSGITKILGYDYDPKVLLWP